MKNINKDYLVTVNAKNATVSAPGAMSFYITDILTSNIFFQLVFSESNNPLIISYAPNEDASNYTLTLRVVKPNNEPKEIEVVLLDQNSNFFIADLTADFIDVLGTYECELFIDTEINGRPERSTTNSFTYTVKPSIFTNAEDIIDTNYLSIDNIATKDYVNQVAFGGEIDLDGYVTDKELSDALANLPTGGESYDDSEIRDLIADKADKEHTHDYATIAYVDSEISAIELTPGPEGPKGDQGEQGPAGADGLTTAISVNGSTYKHANGTITLPDYPSLTGYATTESVNTALNSKADKGHTHDEYLTEVPAEYTTKDYVTEYVGEAIDKYITDDELNDALAGVTGGESYDDTELRNLIDTKADEEHTHNEYITQTEFNGVVDELMRVWVGTQDEYDALAVIESDKIYFIEE